MNVLMTSVPADGATFTISGYGKTYELTEAEFNAAMQAADAIAGASHPMTTGEVAVMLGVSAKTVARLLDAGAMPFHRSGNRGHRIVELKDVLAYKKRRDSRHELIERSRDLAYAMGGYDCDQVTGSDAEAAR